MMIKYILVYYVRSRYLGMKRERIEIFNSLEELVKYRTKHGIKQYEMYRQVI